MSNEICRLIQFVVVIGSLGLVSAALECRDGLLDGARTTCAIEAFAQIPSLIGGLAWETTSYAVRYVVGIADLAHTDEHVE